MNIGWRWREQGAGSKEGRLEMERTIGGDNGGLWLGRERLHLRWREQGARKDGPWLRGRFELPGYLFL